jgi:hypothetical protein
MSKSNENANAIVVVGEKMPTIVVVEPITKVPKKCWKIARNAKGCQNGAKLFREPGANPMSANANAKCQPGAESAGKNEEYK